MFIFPTLIPRFKRGLGSKTNPAKKQKSVNNFSHPPSTSLRQTVSYHFYCFSFVNRNIVLGDTFLSFIQLPEHHAV